MPSCTSACCFCSGVACDVAAEEDVDDVARQQPDHDEDRDRDRDERRRASRDGRLSDEALHGGARGRAGARIAPGPPADRRSRSLDVGRSADPVLKSVNATYMFFSRGLTTCHFDTETSGTSSISCISTLSSFWYIGSRFFGSSWMRPLPISRNICVFPP